MRGITDDGTASGAALISSYIITQCLTVQPDPRQTDVYPLAVALILTVLDRGPWNVPNCSEWILLQPKKETTSSTSILYTSNTGTTIV